MKFSMLKLAQPLNLLSKIGLYAVIAVLLLIGTFQGNAQVNTTFNYTGAPQYWTVPACVTSIQVTCAGAQGG